ncbi:MAG: glutamine synthetase type III, partial [Bdellovibrionales bacterium]
VQLSASSDGASSTGLKKLQKARKDDLEEVFTAVLSNLEKFQKLMDKSRRITDESDRMYDIVKSLSPAALQLRTACDRAETVVADELWTLPKYREMLFANTLA